MLPWDKDRSYNCFTHGRKKKVVCQKAAYMCFYEISKKFRLGASKDSGTLRPSYHLMVSAKYIQLSCHLNISLLVARLLPSTCNWATLEVIG